MHRKQRTRTDADIFIMLVVSEGTSGNIALHMCEVRSSQQRYRDQGLELCEVAIRIANASLLATRFADGGVLVPCFFAAAAAKTNKPSSCRPPKLSPRPPAVAPL